MKSFAKQASGASGNASQHAISRIAIELDDLKLQVLAWLSATPCPAERYTLICMEPQMASFLRRASFSAFTAVYKHLPPRLAGRCLFSSLPHGVLVRLPSGRELLYPYVKMSTSAASMTYDEQDKRVNIDARKLFRHIVRAILHDLLAALKFHAEQHGILLDFRLHGRRFTVEPDQELAAKQKFLETGTAFLPEWAKGLTLSLKTDIELGNDQHSLII